jgi:subtilisin family serine protease
MGDGMNQKILIFTCLLAAAAIAIGAAAYCMANDNQRTTVVDDSEPSVIDVDAISFDNYATIKKAVQDLNTYGGKITDMNGKTINIISGYTVELYGDIIVGIISDSGYTYYDIVDIHDIRTIRVNH